MLFGGDGTGGTFASKRCTAGTSALDRAGTAYIGSCDSSENFPSVASSQSPAGTYNSPADYSCQKNYIVYLTDGEPTNDNEADEYMEGATTSTRGSASSLAECTALGGVWRTSRRGNTCTVTTTTGGLSNWKSVTGGCVGLPNMRAHKVTRMEAWLAARGQRLEDFAETWFYSDSRNDLPLLSRVTHPVVVDPDPELAAHALSHGWAVLHIHPPAVPAGQDSKLDTIQAS